MANILWTVVVVIIILWLLGVVFRIAGGAIHILLLIAIAVVIYNFVTRRRSV